MITALKRGWRVLTQEGPAYLFRKAAWWVGEFLRVCCAILTIGKPVREYGTERLLDLVFNGYGGLIRPIQSRAEMERFIGLTVDKRPHAVLEIGSARGGTLLMLCHAASERARVISIDLPYGTFGGGYPVWKAPLYKLFAKKGQRLSLIRGDSHKEDTLNRVKNALGGAPIDLLFIDGDHTYEGVKKDFEMYAPLTGKGSIIALHDIVLHVRESGCEVHRYWDEIRSRYDSIEIIADKNQQSFGIGVLRVD